MLDLSILRLKASRCALLLSLGILGGTTVAIYLAWYCASRDGMIPHEWWTFSGNHGPWRQYAVGREMTGFAMEFPIVAFMTAMLSILIKPSKAGVIAALIAALVFGLVAATHYWLID